MFTGIIEELGKVRKVSRRGNLTLFEISANDILSDAKPGDSIAVNGACLTVVKIAQLTVEFEAMPETIRLTNLGVLRIGDKVNLERSLKVGDRMSGHFVLGHIDCPGVIRRKMTFCGNLRFDIAIPLEFMDFCRPKNSIAVDGISLTVQERKPALISVYVIPHTLKNTTLGFRNPSDKVNIEFDTLIKNSSRH